MLDAPVYALILENPYRYSIMLRVLDPPPEGWHEIPYLDPESVERRSRYSPTPMDEGYPMDPAGVPRKLRWESKKPLPDVVMASSVNIVSDDIRSTSESFEPGVHQFLPAETYRQKDPTPLAHYHWLIACRRIDGVERSLTTWRQGLGEFWERAGEDSRLVLSLKAIGAAHLWRDPYLLGYLFCSNALANALAARPHLGWDFMPFEAA